MAAQRQVARSGPPRRRRSGSAMTARTVPSAALTRFVVASRYMPVYLALILLVVVAAIWVPETLSPVALVSDRPVRCTARDHRARPDVGDHDRRHRSQHPGHPDARGDDHGRSRRAVRQPHLDRDPRGGGRRRPHRVGERDPHRWAQVERPDRHPRDGPDRGRSRQPLREHVPDPECGTARSVRLGGDPDPGRQPHLLDGRGRHAVRSSWDFATPRSDAASRWWGPTRSRPR